MNSDALISSFLTVIVSELGDKTFILTAMLSMKYSKSAVFSGNLTSMTLMMLLAAYIGYTVMNVIDPQLIKILSILVFFYFSVNSFYEAAENDSNPEDFKDFVHNKKWLGVYWQAMVLVFFAEWGDKSQIGIIALSANNPVYLVLSGAIIAIVCCAVIAILFGKIFCAYASERFMQYFSALVFLAFSISGLKDFLTEAYIT